MQKIKKHNIPVPCRSPPTSCCACRKPNCDWKLKFQKPILRESTYFCYRCINSFNFYILKEGLYNITETNPKNHII